MIGNKENAYWNGQWGKHAPKWLRKIGWNKRKNYYRLQIKKELENELS